MKKGLFSLPSKTQIAKGYTRVVYGKRGPYIEFSEDDMIFDVLQIPSDKHWRIKSQTAYYIEYRTIPDNVMIYHQKYCVTYADYKIGMLYVSPKDVIAIPEIQRIPDNYDPKMDIFKVGDHLRR